MTLTASENLQEYMVLYAECVSFLHQEAELMDNAQLFQWLDGLTPDIDYRIPQEVA
ncbi:MULTISPECIES: hypothetical protein [unclassified Paenibacillus]|uniref:hypothetical protein n=1 Tax=unclassified Paenibacillus TaxID=185978 RepID=UPI001AE58055|nr:MULTISPECIES: hypothetical protein [unclassified Paenibacillus]MBP1154058.1 3-phenylpropionate/cinnamic acid dioxygenase small subunit [Paenibacillus sp. PvP091]MBP1170557.1 3-phenylpropionate/cinnamic acid dioxygenase small subunit [Paenibacillus sp. PvR098]MBP2441585.1 3-phenylpropionate/cinnamic acid dioxygenase small subunit [Paenibacillus sp. PvP052]